MKQLFDLIFLIAEEIKYLEIQMEYSVSALLLTSMGYSSGALWAAGWVSHSWLKAALVYTAKANAISYSSCVSSMMNCILITLFEAALTLLPPASWTSALHTPSFQDSLSLFCCWESVHSRIHQPKNYLSELSLIRTKSTFTRVSLSVRLLDAFSAEFSLGLTVAVCAHVSCMVITLMISF